MYPSHSRHRRPSCSCHHLTCHASSTTFATCGQRHLLLLSLPQEHGLSRLGTPSVVRAPARVTREARNCCRWRLLLLLAAAYRCRRRCPGWTMIVRQLVVSPRLMNSSEFMLRNRLLSSISNLQGYVIKTRKLVQCQSFISMRNGSADQEEARCSLLLYVSVALLAAMAVCLSQCPCFQALIVRKQRGIDHSATIQRH